MIKTEVDLKLIAKLVRPCFVLLASLLICFSGIDSNGKENLLLALISGYFGNLTSYNEETEKDSKLNSKKLL